MKFLHLLAIPVCLGACATLDDVGVDPNAGSASAGDAGTGGDGGEAGDGGDAICEPGEELECGCPGGVPGTEICADDGMSWSECDCPGGSGGTASGGTASGGTASGGTASGGTASGGTASGGTASGGTASGGTASGGTASGGTASGGAPTSSPDNGTDECPPGEIEMTSDYVEVVGNSSPFTNKNTSCEGTSNTCGGRDVFYSFKATRTGQAHVTLDTLSNFSGAICYTEGTCTPGTNADCEGRIQMYDIVELDFLVMDGQTYNLVIDGRVTSSSGPFEFTLWLE